MDLLKERRDIILEKLAALFSECLRTQKVLIACKNANIVQIHKGDPKDIKNYMPISLLSVVYKILSKVIVNRIRDSLDYQQPREQSRFRKGYSTIDPIHVVNQVIEKFAEYTKPLYMAFIDYEIAFDSIQTAAVLKAIQDQGIEHTYITDLLDDIYKGCTGMITLHKQCDKFPFQKGVRQGDPISPKLFTA